MQLWPYYSVCILYTFYDEMYAVCICRIILQWFTLVLTALAGARALKITVVCIIRALYIIAVIVVVVVMVCNAVEYNLFEKALTQISY